MPVLYLLPTGDGVGNFSLSHGLQYAFEQKNHGVVKFNPLFDIGINEEKLVKLFLANQLDDVIEKILDTINALKKNHKIIIVSGVHSSNNLGYMDKFNNLLIKTINAYVILVTRHGMKSLPEIEQQISYFKRQYGNTNLIGSIITKLNAPAYNNGSLQFNFLNITTEDRLPILDKADIYNLKVFDKKFPLIGVTEWSDDLIQPLMSDVVRTLKLKILNKSDLNERRATRVIICARTINNLADEMTPGTVIITSSDRTDILILASLAAAKGIVLAGIILAGKYKIKKSILNLCLRESPNLPILTTPASIISVVMLGDSLVRTIIPQSDKKRLNMLKEHVASYINVTPLENILSIEPCYLFSPPAFKYSLITKAQKVKKRILLPEGTEPRTIAAANICAQKNIAICQLIGNKNQIHQIAKNHGLTLSSNIEIIEPENIRNKYIKTLLKLRKHKELSKEGAKQQLEDNVMLATIMLKLNESDGLVSGAEHTTANTIRPALQIIKTRPNSKIVSSVFFMCMPDQVMVFGDCAVNLNPTPGQLADIAIQSADTATSFGIQPKVAMISYSTGDSGSGSEVEKVKQATKIVQNSRPDLIIDGPLQYDAAVTESVAMKKAPNSHVAGKANVIIFPDLNTGNTTYKAVQRSANILCIGPVLQGMNKPVNDLSRGATIDDIVFTIAITAIQAQS